MFDSLKRRFHARFDLRHDQAGLAEIDETFRSGVEFRGTNLWVLIFAIFIASIGLNVNSTAVIIGAMLISPLMGPIMAMGYGAGINDSALMRSSLFNLGLAALISLLTSTAYFLITPLGQAHSELLARTTPNIWDVLIALFGGLAGAIGVTRKVKSNLVPGVAIATALMPPLCTAGYGLASGNLGFFFGAFYLFSINCVFIAISTLLMVKVMRLPSVRELEGKSIFKRRTVIAVVVLATMVPSLFLALNLVQREWFQSSANRYVQSVFGNRSSVLVVSQELDFEARRIALSLAGDRLTEADLEAARARLAEFGLGQASLVVTQSGQAAPDVNAIKRDILRDLLASNRSEIAQRDETIAALRAELETMRRSADASALLKQIQAELQAQFPDARQVRVSAGVQLPDQATVLMVQLNVNTTLTQAERQRLRQWLRERAKLDSVEQVVLLVEAPQSTARAANGAKKR